MTSRTRRLLLAAAAVLMAGMAFDRYTREPATFAVTPLDLDPDTRAVVLVFHGSGGRDEPDVVALGAQLAGLARGEDHTLVTRYVWSPWSDARFRAGENGLRVGRVLGAQLAALPRLESLHLVAHSAGAYVLEPLCAAVKAGAAGPVSVAMTYLDPMGVRGAADFGWGARHYGACADYAEAFINTDDPVPGTNAPLDFAWNVDVTAAAGSATYAAGGHRWPVRYYRDHLTPADLTAHAYRQADRPRGTVEVR